MPEENFEGVTAILTEYYYEPRVIPAEELGLFCVVKEQYTPYAVMLKQSVAHWSREGHNFLLMKDQQAVEYAVELGAQRLEDTSFVLGL